MRVRSFRAARPATLGSAPWTGYHARVMQWPDYEGGSLVNLMQRLRLATGAPRDEQYPPLQHAGLDDLQERRVLVLFVVDGLGYNYLTRSAPGSFLAAHLQGSLTAGFPPTTAASISTFLTGQAVQQHALTGWYVYLKEIGAVTAVLPFNIRGSTERLSQRGVSAEDLYGHRPFFTDLEIPSHIIAPNWIIHTDFNRAHCGPATARGFDDLEGLFQALSAVIRETQGRQYVYVYWPEFDRLSHEYGNASAQVAAHFKALDSRFRRFAEGVDNDEVGIVVTADHGFIDTTPQRVITVNDHPPLQQALQLPLCGEPRAAYCYVRPQYAQIFRDYCAHELGDYLQCHESETLIAEGLFGRGTPHPRLSERVGHYTLLMKDNYIIKDWLQGEKRFFHKGVHGGTSPSEMQVPLITV